jgi:hypothetical protein
MAPNRWMRLRQPARFTDDTFDVFCASCESLKGYANALLANWHRFPGHSTHPSVAYTFFSPELSADRTIASLPIGGGQLLGTRVAIENMCSYMLWQHLPMEFMEGLEEGLTETIDPSKGFQTNWRLPSPSIGFIKADPELRKRFSR